MTNTSRSNAGQRAPADSQQLYEEREARVLGSGPRLLPLGIEELSDDLTHMIERMAHINSAIDSREQSVLTGLMPRSEEAAIENLAEKLANLPEIMRTMLRHPQLFARQTEVGIQLLSRGALSARDRELGILRIAWLCQAPYEWGEHVIIAKKVGITSEEVERITQGSQAPDWGEHEQAILRATEELHEEAMISDATWAILSKRLDDRQLIELPALIGQYQAVAYTQNSLRLRLHQGNRGLKAR
jgi:alkylhydroperoxidase family enzyme